MIGALQVVVHLGAEAALGDGVVRVAPEVQGAAGGAVHGDLPTARVRAVVGADAGDDVVFVFPFGRLRRGRVVCCVGCVCGHWQGGRKCCFRK